MTPRMGVRLANAWLVLRGVVDPDAIRVLYYRESARVDAEMRSHQATLDRWSAEMNRRAPTTRVGSESEEHP